MVLVIMWPNVGPFGQALRQLQRFSIEFLRRYNAIVEPPPLAFFCRHRASGVEKFGGAALTDDPRQYGTGAHVAAREADPGEQESRFCIGGRQTQVRCHGDDSASTNADAIDRRNDRLAAMHDRLDEIPGHAGEFEQALHIHLHQRPDNIVHIAAGTEIAAIGTEDHRLDIVGIGEGAETIAKFGITVERQRVLAFRAIERDDRNAVLAVPFEMGGLVVRHLTHLGPPRG